MSFWAMDSLNPNSSLTNISTFPSFELLVTSINHPNWCLTGKHPNNFPEQTRLHQTAGGMAWFVGWSTLVCPTAEHSGGVIHPSFIFWPFGNIQAENWHNSSPPKNSHRVKIGEWTERFGSRCKCRKKQILLDARCGNFGAEKAIWCLDISLRCFFPGLYVECSPNDSDTR